MPSENFSVSQLEYDECRPTVCRRCLKSEENGRVKEKVSKQPITC